MCVQTGEKREVLQFQYTTWPDFGVPTSPTTFLHFLTIVRDAGCLDPDTGPAIIHCSAGIGRSGTFCLVDSSLVLVSRKKRMFSFILKLFSNVTVYFSLP
jgi:tyrosine-protein phosphatase non-receptor type 1